MAARRRCAGHERDPLGCCRAGSGPIRVGSHAPRVSSGQRRKFRRAGKSHGVVRPKGLAGRPSRPVEGATTRPGFPIALGRRIKYRTSPSAIPCGLAILAASAMTRTGPGPGPSARRDPLAFSTDSPGVRPRRRRGSPPVGYRIVGWTRPASAPECRRTASSFIDSEKYHEKLILVQCNFRQMMIG